MKRHRRDYEMMADINLTNLLDTAFVLLIAFIMASPSMRPNGLHVDLPEVVNPGDLPKPLPLSQAVTITIRKITDLPGQPEWVYVDGENKVDLTNGASGLETYLKGKKGTNPNQKLDVIIQVDKESRYNVLAQVLAILKNEGIDSVGLPMIPETPDQAAGSGPNNVAKKK